MELNEKTLKKLNSEHKKMFTGNSKLKNTRPVLNSLHYSKEGHVEFTNSHVAVRIKDVHSDPEHTVPDGIGQYPDLGRLFDGAEYGSINLELDTKALSDMLSPFKTEKVDVVKITFDKTKITFAPVYTSKKANWDEGWKDIIQGAELKCELDLNEPFQIAFNVKYLYNAFMFFKTQKMLSVKMTASSPIRPVLLKYENVQYLITPVRMGG